MKGLRLNPNAGKRGMLLWELVVAMSILLMVFFPLSLSLLIEKQNLRAGYYRALAIEIVDGEMEILMAGEWRAFADGKHDYPVKSSTATNLPPGEFQFTVEGRHLKLEWLPAPNSRGGRVTREALVP